MISNNGSGDKQKIVLKIQIKNSYEININENTLNISKKNYLKFGHLNDTTYLCNDKYYKSRMNTPNNQTSSDF